MAELSVIIPAHNEADWIVGCLTALFASEGPLPAREVIVVANACRDDTAQQVRARLPHAAAAGWTLLLIETDVPGKIPALNQAETEARGTVRAYLDADVTVSPGLLKATYEALAHPNAAYATGSPLMARSPSAVSRAYARFWSHLPFVTDGTPGFGFFAVNTAGRARWDSWPDLIADDMFVRLNFAPAERTRLPQTYHWPPVPGFANLVRVRRRQNAGVRELAQNYPALTAHEDKAAPSLTHLLGMAIRDPIGCLAYAAVSLGVRSPFFASTSRWARGR